MQVRFLPVRLASYSASSARSSAASSASPGAPGGDAGREGDEDLAALVQEQASRQAALQPRQRLLRLGRSRCAAAARRTPRRRSAPGGRPGAAGRAPRAASDFSATSPAAWPRLSLSFLKLSMSIRPTASGAALALAARHSRPRRPASGRAGWPPASARRWTPRRTGGADSAFELAHALLAARWRAALSACRRSCGRLHRGLHGAAVGEHRRAPRRPGSPA